MNSEGKKFFRLNYLCAKSPNSEQNQNLILERTIKNENKISKIKSNIISVSQNFSSQKNYYKFDNSKYQLNKNKSFLSKKIHHKFTRTKSGNEKTFNNSYFYDKSILSSNYTENNSYISNKKINNHKTLQNDNFSQLNFTINNFIPVADSQYQKIKNKNKTFYIKIENPYYYRNNINNRKTPIIQKGKKLKTFFCLNQNLKEDNNKEKEFKEDNIYKNNLSINNANNKSINLNNTLTKKERKSATLDFSKFLNDKNNIRLLVKNKRKLKNYIVKKKETLSNKSNKTDCNNKIVNEDKNIEKIKIKNNETIIPMKRNKTFNSQKFIGKKGFSLKEEINKKNQIIKEKEEMIQTLLNKYEQSKERIKYLEKYLDDIKKENDDLYKYKSLYDDKEIELIQYKNNINKFEFEYNNYISLKYNYGELLNKYNKSQEIKNIEINNIKTKYNDLLTKYNNIMMQMNELDELKMIKMKYNQLLAQNQQLIEIRNKYYKIKDEYDELKIIREKYGKILKEQKNYILMENKYNDLLEEIKELREIKHENERVVNKKSSGENYLFKNSNISFGAENNII